MALSFEELCAFVDLDADVLTARHARPASDIDRRMAAEADYAELLFRYLDVAAELLHARAEQALLTVLWKKEIGRALAAEERLDQLTGIGPWRDE